MSKKEPERFYIVSHSGGEALVEANTATQALTYWAKRVAEVRIATTKEVVKLMSGRVELVRWTGEPEQQDLVDRAVADSPAESAKGEGRPAEPVTAGSLSTPRGDPYLPGIHSGGAKRAEEIFNSLLSPQAE